MFQCIIRILFTSETELRLHKAHSCFQLFPVFCCCLYHMFNFCVRTDDDLVTMVTRMLAIT